MPISNDRRIYAIGDVHGRSDLLELMLDAIAEQGNPYSVVFLGDIIDRAIGSSKAMQLVWDTLEKVPGSLFIKGNHEEYFLRIMDASEDEEIRARVLDRWKQNGGEATLFSYGFVGYEDAHLITMEMEERFPEHVKALREAADMHVAGDFVFVHAGIRPGIPIADQNPRDLRWIRDDFLNCGDRHEKYVIHGHSITGDSRADVRINRINIDTGAYDSGRLTAVMVPETGSELMLLSTRNGTVETEVVKFDWAGN